MLLRKYNYVAVDGNHWPDADKGDNLYYAIDFSCYLTNESETITNIEWVVPDGLLSTENFLTGNVANVKLFSPKVGSYQVKCIMRSEDSGHTQTNVVPMMLKVY